MPVESAGILIYKRDAETLLVLLVHPGGPFWARKDAGAWSITKGERTASENLEAAARREFEEELGVSPTGPLLPLGRIRQRAGKEVEAFAMEGDFDVERLRSNLFQMEWPPHSGRIQSFPEVDRAAWFTLPAAHEKILASQRPLLDRLEALTSSKPESMR